MTDVTPQAYPLFLALDPPDGITRQVIAWQQTAPGTWAPIAAGPDGLAGVIAPEPGLTLGLGATPEEAARAADKSRKEQS